VAHLIKESGRVRYGRINIEEATGTCVSQTGRFEMEILTQAQNPKALMSVICHT
jgi:hypothetical protein